MWELGNNICDCLSKNLPFSHQNWIQFYCCSLRTHSISIQPQCIKCWMLSGLQHFANPPEWRLEQWDSWRVPIGQWGPVFAPTDYVAHFCIIGHCVGIMAAHGVFIGVVFATSYPTTPTLPPLLSILTAERDCKKYLKIQPWEASRVSYNKNQ